MIQFIKVNKHFGKFQALKDINLKLKNSQAIALIGPNGCGKTTLIKSILGMVVPDNGEIKVGTKPIKGKWLYRNHIGYMPQMGRYPENLSVAQLLSMIKDIRSIPEEGFDEDLYHDFCLDSILHKKMGELSGGTRQKVSAQLAFLCNPHILILDEPTAGLDPLASEIFKEKVQKEKAKGKMILITSHNLADLDDMVDQVVYMQDGEVIFNKSLEKLKVDTGKVRLPDAVAQLMREEVQHV